MVVLPTGAWLTPNGDGLDLAGNPNMVTADIPASRFSQGCAANSCLVSVEKVETPLENPLELQSERLQRLSSQDA